jgi:hypothetical protein
MTGSPTVTWKVVTDPGRGKVLRVDHASGKDDSWTIATDVGQDWSFMSQVSIKVKSSDGKPMAVDLKDMEGGWWHCWFMPSPGKFGEYALPFDLFMPVEKGGDRNGVLDLMNITEIRLWAQGTGSFQVARIVPGRAPAAVPGGIRTDIMGNGRFETYADGGSGVTTVVKKGTDGKIVAQVDYLGSSTGFWGARLAPAVTDWGSYRYLVISLNSRDSRPFRLEAVDKDGEMWIVTLVPDKKPREYRIPMWAFTPRPEYNMGKQDGVFDRSHITSLELIQESTGSTDTLTVTRIELAK